jgi:hypothetical protein
MIEFEDRIRAYAQEEKLLFESLFDFFGNWLADLPGGVRRRLFDKKPYERSAGLWQGKTWGEFTGDIDQALRGNGISIKEIEIAESDLRQRSAESGFEPELMYQLLQKTFPAYLTLRGRGYSHGDLIA